MCVYCRCIHCTCVYTRLTTCTLRNILTHVKKRKQPEEKLGVIYQIPYECGAVYIGETWRVINHGESLTMPT